MYDDLGGGCGWLVVMVLLVIVAGAVLVPAAWAHLEGMRAERQQAAAERVYAEAAKVEAQTALTAERSEQWRRELQLYGVTLAAFTGGGGTADVCIGAGIVMLSMVLLAVLARGWQ
jgi:hypothetical protein